MAIAAIQHQRIVVARAMAKPSELQATLEQASACCASPTRAASSASMRIAATSFGMFRNRSRNMLRLRQLA